MLIEKAQIAAKLESVEGTAETLTNAEALLVFERVGSLEAGKDADLGIWTGSPVDPRSQCKMTLVEGRIAYDAKVRRRY